MQDVEAEVDEALSMQLCDIADRSHKTHQDIVHRLGGCYLVGRVGRALFEPCMGVCVLC
jgi:hypothetical protein